MSEKVILRIDDIGRLKYKKIINRIFEEVYSREIFVVFGVIPIELQKHNQYVSKIKKEDIDKRIEFALHGFTHDKWNNSIPEFNLNSLTKEDYQQIINGGKNLFKKELNLEPQTFIPPGNTYVESVKEAIIESNIKVISATKKEISEKRVETIPWDARAENFNPHRLVEVSKIIRDLKESTKNSEVKVIMIHPQDYLKKDETDEFLEEIDENKYQNYFIKLLDELKKLNYEFTTFEKFLEEIKIVEGFGQK